MEPLHAEEFESPRTGGPDGQRRLPAPACRLRIDHRAHLLPAPGPSLAASVLRLARIRSLSEIPGIAAISRLLEEVARRCAPFGDGGPFGTHQTGRIARRRRRVPAPLIYLSVQ